jgi:hypothetical protein
MPDSSNGASVVAGNDVGASVDADEQAARHAREQYREAGIPLIDPDTTVVPFLADGEQVLGSRPDAAIARVEEATDGAIRDLGPLYVTTRRLLHLGREVSSIDLADILELAMAEDRILVTLAGARGVMLDVSDPRQFRVLIAAAKSAARG